MRSNIISYFEDQVKMKPTIVYRKNSGVFPKKFDPGTVEMNMFLGRFCSIAGYEDM